MNIKFKKKTSCIINYPHPCKILVGEAQWYEHTAELIS